MNFIVICKDDTGRYVQPTRRAFTKEEAEHYVLTLNPGRKPMIVADCTVEENEQTQKCWTKDQIENFLRHETTASDETCKRMASWLFKNGVFNIAGSCSPNDYSNRIE